MLGGVFSRIGFVAGIILALIVGIVSGQVWPGLFVLAGVWGVGAILSWIFRAPQL